MFLVSGIGAWLSTVHKLNQHNHDWLNFIIVVIFIFIIVIIIIIIIIMPEIKLLSKTFSPACRLRPAGRPLRCDKGQGGCGFSLQESSVQALPCKMRVQIPASQTQARLVSRLCVGKLFVDDWVKMPVYFLFLKCQAGGFEISTEHNYNYYYYYYGCSKTICMHSVIKQHRTLSVTCAHKRNLKGITK